MYIVQAIQKWSKEIKSDNCCYCKVGRAIIIEGEIEKSPKNIAILKKTFDSALKNISNPISHFKTDVEQTFRQSNVDNSISKQLFKWPMGGLSRGMTNCNFGKSFLIMLFRTEGVIFLSYNVLKLIKSKIKFKIVFLLT